MFANDKNIDNLQQLFVELKKYAELQKDYVKLHLVEKHHIGILSDSGIGIGYSRYHCPLLPFFYISLCIGSSCRRIDG